MGCKAEMLLTMRAAVFSATQAIRRNELHVSREVIKRRHFLYDLRVLIRNASTQGTP